MGRKEIIEDHVENVELYLSPAFPETNTPLPLCSRKWLTTKDPVLSQNEVGLIPIFLHDFHKTQMTLCPYKTQAPFGLRIAIT